MGRAPRILLNGAVYHVYQKCNNGEFILQNPRHKAFFIKQLKEYNIKFDYQLLAYVIMDNHYHLLIQTNEDTIDKIMFNINNVVAKFLGRELGKIGHIYGERYNCILVEDDAYLLWLLRYIHRNPVKAHICDSVDKYKWSSHLFYERNLNNFVNTDFILKIISPNKQQAIKQYIRLMDISGNEDSDDMDFKAVKEIFELNETSSLTDVLNSISTSRLGMEEILSMLNISLELKQLLKNGSRAKTLTPYKIQFLIIALKYKYTLVEIGEFLNTSPLALSKYIAYHRIGR